MAANRAKPSKRSTNSKTTGDFPGQRRNASTGRARAHRDDTPEAREQQRRLPKTHPTRNPSASRKDQAEKPKSRAVRGGTRT